ncbi:MAG: MFS transporter [Chloroflexi bacterium]|nr:MFS transporter [Chloroflexota bacterium]
MAARLPALRHRDFRALWIGSACSSISLWTLLLGNAWIVYKLSDSSLWVGVSTFASMSPYLVAPLGGMVADRAERRILVRVTRLATFGVTIALTLLALANVIEVWMVVSLAFVQGIIRSVEIPSDQALLANVVPISDLGNAVALTSTTQHGSRAAGPLLAGPLLATIGVEGAYGISALFALLAFASVRRVSVSSRGGVTRLRDVGENMREGMVYIGRTPEVAAIFILVFAHCSLTMSFDAMLPGFAETRLHSPSGGFTIMTFGVGVGALVGTFVLAMTTGARRGPLLLGTALASGISPMLMAGSHHVPHAAVGAILMGSSQAMFMALSAVLLQEVVPDHIRGRVMSLYLMSAGGVMAFMNLGFGAMADRTGAPILFFLPGAAFVVITLASIATGPYLRRIYRTGTAVAVAPAA